MQGYIYVEAHKEASVKEALRGLRMIFGSKPPQLVPLREMVDAIRVPRTTAKAIGKSTGCNKHATGSWRAVAGWGRAGAMPEGSGAALWLQQCWAALQHWKPGTPFARVASRSRAATLPTLPPLQLEYKYLQ
jgi:hypothetical protein